MFATNQIVNIAIFSISCYTTKFMYNQFFLRTDIIQNSKLVNHFKISQKHVIFQYSNISRTDVTIDVRY